MFGAKVGVKRIPYLAKRVNILLIVRIRIYGILGVWLWTLAPAGRKVYSSTWTPTHKSPSGRKVYITSHQIFDKIFTHPHCRLGLHFLFNMSIIILTKVWTILNGIYISPRWGFITGDRWYFYRHSAPLGLAS